MNAKELLCALYDGASLKERWKPRGFSMQKPKKEVILTYPDGKQEKIQRCNLEALLKTRAIETKRFVSGGFVEYGLSNDTP